MKKKIFVLLIIISILFSNYIFAFDKSNSKDISEIANIIGDSTVLQSDYNAISMGDSKSKDDLDYGKSIDGSQKIIQKAIECHKYLRERGFTYGNSGTGIPGFIDDGYDLVDCSLYVGWVLYEAGYDPYVAYESDYYSDDHGFTIVPNNEVQPGDILNITGRHVEIAAAVENG